MLSLFILLSHNRVRVHAQQFHVSQLKFFCIQILYSKIIALFAARKLLLRDPDQLVIPLVP